MTTAPAILTLTTAAPTAEVLADLRAAVKTARGWLAQAKAAIAVAYDAVNTAPAVVAARAAAADAIPACHAARGTPGYESAFAAYERAARAAAAAEDAARVDMGVSTLRRAEVAAEEALDARALALTLAQVAARAGEYVLAFDLPEDDVTARTAVVSTDGTLAGLRLARLSAVGRRYPFAVVDREGRFVACAGSRALAAKAAKAPGDRIVPVYVGPKVRA